MARVAKEHLDLFYQHGIDIGTKCLYLMDSSEGEIDARVAADITKGLHILSRIRPEEPIYIIINSGGGDVNQGLAIYDAIRRTPCKVIATVVGTCYSIAAWILQAADHRIMTPHSSLMIHEGETAYSGNVQTVHKSMEFDARQSELCEALLIERIREKHPGFPMIKLKRLLRIDTYMTPQEALDLGLIDEISEV